MYPTPGKLALEAYPSIVGGLASVTVWVVEHGGYISEIWIDEELVIHLGCERRLSASLD